MQVNLEQKSNTMKKTSIRKFIKGQIKALHESKKHVVKYSKSNNTYQVWLGDEIVTDFATKEKANAKAKNLNDLQNAKDVDKAQLKEAEVKGDVVNLHYKIDVYASPSDGDMSSVIDYVQNNEVVNKYNIKVEVGALESGPQEDESSVYVKFSLDRSKRGGTMTAIRLLRDVVIEFIEKKIGAVAVDIEARDFKPDGPSDDEYDQMAQQSSMDDRRQQGMNPGLEETARDLGYLEETEKVSLALLYTDSGRFYKATFNGQNIGIDDVNRLLKSKDVNMAVPPSYDDEKLDQIGNALGSHGISMSHIDNKDVSEGESKLKEMASALGYMNEGDELARLLKVSSQANVKMGEDKLYKLAMAWEAWNVDNDDKHDDLVDHLFAAVELVQDAGSVKNREYYMYLRSAKKHLKQFNIDVDSISENNLNGGELNEYTLDGGTYLDDATNELIPRYNMPIEIPGDMFAQKEVDELLPASMKSRNQELKARLQAHAKWTEDSQYNLTFVHAQSNTVVDGNNTFRIAMSQYYNHHHKGPSSKNPKFTQIRVKSLDDGNENDLGLYIVDTDTLMEDLKNLETINRQS